MFAYTITITNTGTVAAQLISRHWIITDAENVTQEVRGLGVVGDQPLLQPGESFEYTSGTAIATPVGTMNGSYQMVAEDGTQFDAEIPRVHAVDAARSALNPCVARQGRTRPIAADRSSRHFFIVHQTMNTNRLSAIPASSNSQPSPWLSIKPVSPLLYSTRVFDLSHLHP